MARGDQASRQWQLIRLLTGKYGRTLSQLRVELAVTKRTIQRDIAVLERAGFPVISEERNGTVFWRFMDGFQAESPVSLSLAEQMALYFARGLFRPLQGTPMYDSLQSVVEKIEKSLPAPSTGMMRQLDSAISVSLAGWKDYSRSRDVIGLLSKAVLNNYRTTILHAAAGRAKPIYRDVNPYRIWYVNGGLYLVGHDHRAAEIRVFAVERINAVKLTHRRFHVPHEFDFERLKSAAFQMIWGEPQDVEIRFSKAQAPYVLERTWHPSQTATKCTDGSVILHLRVGDLGEVKRWVFGFGSEAVVLKPTKLRREIAHEAARLVRALK